MAAVRLGDGSIASVEAVGCCRRRRGGCDRRCRSGGSAPARALPGKAEMPMAGRWLRKPRDSTPDTVDTNAAIQARWTNSTGTKEAKKAVVRTGAHIVTQP